MSTEEVSQFFNCADCGQRKAIGLRVTGTNCFAGGICLSCGEARRYVKAPGKWRRKKVPSKLAPKFRRRKHPLLRRAKTSSSKWSEREPALAWVWAREAYCSGATKKAIVEKTGFSERELNGFVYGGRRTKNGYSREADSKNPRWRGWRYLKQEREEAAAKKAQEEKELKERMELKSKRDKLVEMMEGAMEVSRKAIDRLKESEEELTVNQVTQVVGIVKELSTLARIEEGLPTEYIKQEKAVSVSVLLKRIQAADPLIEYSPRSPGGEIMVEDAEYEELPQTKQPEPLELEAEPKDQEMI